MTTKGSGDNDHKKRGNMRRIDTEALERQIDFQRLAGQYTTLKQRGQAWHGLCPFHDEHTASFTITGDKWHCFGCDAKGAGAIRFVMDYHKLDFLPACEWLARWAGIPLPIDERSARSANATDEGRLNSSLTDQKKRQEAGAGDNQQAEELARWQSGCLLLSCHRDGTPAAQSGVDYLKMRGLSPIFAVWSGVMFHPDWYGHARVVFPIMRPHDGDIDNAETIALQGRAIAPDVSKKDRLRCVGAKREGAFWTPNAWTQDIIVFTEGEIEALTIAECGFPAVATCGAGNRAPWLGAMCRGRHVIIAFDDDTGGDNGANALATLLRQSGVKEIDGILPPDIRHVDGKAFDWNDCLREYGREAVRNIIMDAIIEKRHQDTIDTTLPGG